MSEFLQGFFYHVSLSHLSEAWAGRAVLLSCWRNSQSSRCHHSCLRGGSGWGMALLGGGAPGIPAEVWSRRAGVVCAVCAGWCGSSALVWGLRPFPHAREGSCPKAAPALCCLGLKQRGERPRCAWWLRCPAEDSSRGVPSASGNQVSSVHALCAPAWVTSPAQVLLLGSNTMGLLGLWTFPQAWANANEVMLAFIMN